eukprot:TRINITY_DN261_c0_g2_i2.p1 TRINITY_DN261_c0_g2~~TRINITY_DN261_c0_g2_i2.p1  ORF type:complete len:342 (-),score=23.18 TRINITY_DN261_c0_g2_i2:98-1123(-)
MSGIGGLYPSVSDAQLLSKLTLGTGCASLWGASFMVVSFILYSRGKTLSKLVLFLSLCDFFWSSREVALNLIIIYRPQLDTYPVCMAFRVVFQLASGSSVLWICCISIYLYLHVLYGEGFKEEKLMLSYHLLSWGVPILLTVIIFAGGHIPDTPTNLICTPMPYPHMFFWIIPLFVVMLITTFIYVLLIRQLLKKKPDEDKESLHHSFRGLSNVNIPPMLLFRLSLYVVVLFVCWTPDITRFTLESFANIHNRVFFFTSGPFMVSQGAFNCLVYGVTNRQLRNRYGGFWQGFWLFLLAPFVLVGLVGKIILFKMLGKPNPYASESIPPENTHLLHNPVEVN